MNNWSGVNGNKPETSSGFSSEWFLGLYSIAPLQKRIKCAHRTHAHTLAIVARTENVHINILAKQKHLILFDNFYFCQLFGGAKFYLVIRFTLVAHAITVWRSVFIMFMLCTIFGMWNGRGKSRRLATLWHTIKNVLARASVRSRSRACERANCNSQY